MTTKTRTVNVTKGKQGFQETEKTVSSLMLDELRADIGTQPEGVSTDLNASRAYDLRRNARVSLIVAGHEPDAMTDPKANMRVIAAAQVFTLLNFHGTAVDDSWGEGGKKFAQAAVHGGDIPPPNDYYPLTAERREAIAQEMLDVAMGQYKGDVGSPNLYDYASNRDAYIQNACLALDDNGTRYDVANELKRICDEEVTEGRDPRSLDRLSLYLQARTTVEAKNDTGTCVKCGSPTVFDVDYGYAHCADNCS